LQSFIGAVLPTVKPVITGSAMSICRSLLFRQLAGIAVCLFGLAASGVHAQTAADAGDASGIYASAQRWLNDTVASGGGNLPLRMEVSVGELDRRLKLAPCERVEPYIPAGTQLWGKTRLGLRCVQGVSRWNVFLPVTVRAFGPAWVVKGQVAPGATLSESDAMMMEVDWAESNSPVVANQADWLGQTATRMLSTGQPLRQDMVKAAQVFQAGAQVRVVAVGTGFEIATSAQALSAGVIGQSARVRMDNGRVATGQVMDGRTVRLAL
jgi:flagella basal body P-ring formation protein FlgA